MKRLIVKILRYNYCGMLHYTLRYRFFLRKAGRKSYISRALKITPRHIELGDGASVGKNCRIEGITRYAGETFDPVISLGSSVSIEQNLHLTCARSVAIGDNTAIAANVSITDIRHPYEDIDTPVERQKIEVDPVRIGPDCKIFNNAVILPGVTIGRHVVVGANSVVVRDLPDYCVVSGCPAKIIRKYNFTTRTWEKES